ncbi:MAG: hypothetical protein JWO31_1372 [Phycisphaerales bacterium]|nr:hypothetical protein [Phycisphaerales bacterium]
MTVFSHHANCLLDPPAAVAAWFAGGGSAAAGGAISGAYRVRPAADAWELAGYRRLRHDVFCREQGLFAGTDADAFDGGALPLVAVSSATVADDDVVGTVRIDERSPGVWWGSRLAVARDWRGVPGLAADLIRAAVRTAAANGCHTFLATVQRQNVPLFRRLRWARMEDVEVCGRPHVLMRAALDQ